MELYKQWLASDALTDEERLELQSLPEEEISDRFYTSVKFGTAGIRGVCGMGTNRFNRFIVAQTTKALANTIKASDEQGLDGVVIGYDSRLQSSEFAHLCAEIMASNGIKSYIYNELCPTPLVSFGIRHYKTIAGINITASHNPKQYNGYKVYWANGAQLDDAKADYILDQMSKIDIFEKQNHVSFEEGVKSGLIVILGEETERIFLDEAHKMLPDKSIVSAVADDFSVVFTPFHGAGYRLVPQLLEEVGIKNIYPVPEQMVIDGNFPTVKVPNPEEIEGFTLGIKIAEEKGSDLIIGTDPDADRVGVICKDHDGSFKPLSGNMIGCLLADFIIQMNKDNMPKNPMIVKSLVSSTMVEKICAFNDVACYASFTGFRFIAELIDGKPESNALLAFEESYGYLVGDYARDKDAVTASALIAEMACFYKAKGMILLDAVEELYKKYGYFVEKTLSITMPGADGLSKMQKLMKDFRSAPRDTIADTKVARIKYYSDGAVYDFTDWTTMDLSGSDVVTFELVDGSTYIVRPSGTEPKVKVYILVEGSSIDDANAKIAKFEAFTPELFA